MSDILKQTWWDNNLNNKSMFNTFLGWVGDSSAPSKKRFREFLKDQNFKSIVDVGCGPATEFFGFANEGIEIQYTGVDSSEFLVNYNQDRNIPMVLAEAHNIPVPDDSFEVAFSRHVLEHQPTFAPVIDELIRISSKLAVHIWFHKPEDKEIIDYDSGQNLYHNYYRKVDIEQHLLSNKKVKSIEWIDVDDTENILLVWLKE